MELDKIIEYIVQEVIKKTGAMKDSNCAVNNPKGTCCYSDIVYVFNKYK